LSTFISGFSAFILVAAAGFTYKNGMAGLTLFTSAFWAYWLGYFYYGVAWRRSRLSSPMEFLTRRYSPGTTYYYTIVSIIPSILGLGAAIYILCLFIATAMGLGSDPVNLGFISLSPFQIINIVIGLITIAYTAFGGLWAVVITDVIQFLILIIMSVTMVPLAFKFLGGDAGITGGIHTLLFESPPGYFSLTTADQSALFFVSYILMVFLGYNVNWHVGQRYYSVPDERDTRKMAIMCSLLSLLGPIIWAVPSMISRHVFPNIAAYWPHLADPTEASFVSLAMLILPHGMIGLVVASILAATMSSSDSSFNYLSAVVTKDVYVPLTQKFRNKIPTEPQQMRVGRFTILVIGLLSIVVAMYVPRFGGAFQFGLKTVSLFLPGLLLPVMLGFAFTKTPWWSGMASSGTSVGLVLVLNIISLTSGKGMMPYHVNVLTGFITCLSIFFLSAFWKNKKPADIARLAAFQKDLKTPVISERKSEIPTNVILAYRTVGITSILIGALLWGIGFVEIGAEAVFINFISGSISLTVGLVLLYTTHKRIKSRKNKS
ncbi:hypothetical protein KAH55_02405, partial [bacterium]|nr:hypothetical protein [bacterium]